MVRLIRPLQYHGLVLWPGNRLELPRGLAIDMVRDGVARPVKAHPESPDTGLEPGEWRGRPHVIY